MTSATKTPVVRGSVEKAIIVPARLASVRFPRKLLFPLQGRPLVLWTAARIKEEVPEVPLYFAVDGEELGEVLRGEGYAVIATPPDLPSGTDRIALANREIGARRVINVQADEPWVTAAQIGDLFQLLDQEVSMATLATPFTEVSDFQNPNQVKVVCDQAGRALYFSRAPIPWNRDGEPDADWLQRERPLRHLGLYGYSADLLECFPRLSPGRLEQVERLEQLRVLENGYQIGVGLTDSPLPGIDTPEDAERFLERLGESRHD